MATKTLTLFILWIIEMKEFYVVNGDHVEKLQLRETPKFYINDNSGRKFKKSENPDYLAHYRHDGGNWGSNHYYVYDLDHEKPLQLIEKKKRSMFAWRVKKAAEAKLSECKTYSDFVKLNELLGLGVEL